MVYSLGLAHGLLILEGNIRVGCSLQVSSLRHQGCAARPQEGQEVEQVPRGALRSVPDSRGSATSSSEGTDCVRAEHPQCGHCIAALCRQPLGWTIVPTPLVQDANGRELGPPRLSGPRCESARGSPGVHAHRTQRNASASIKTKQAKGINYEVMD